MPDEIVGAQRILPGERGRSCCFDVHRVSGPLHRCVDRDARAGGRLRKSSRSLAKIGRPQYRSRRCILGAARETPRDDLVVRAQSAAE